MDRIGRQDQAHEDAVGFGARSGIMDIARHDGQSARWERTINVRCSRRPWGEPSLLQLFRAADAVFCLGDQ